MRPDVAVRRALGRQRDADTRTPPGSTRPPRQPGPPAVERMTGFEPATSTLARWRSNQLSYIRMMRAPSGRPRAEG